MSLVVVGTVAFDAIETPFGKTDKILGGAATFIGLAAGKLNVDAKIVSVVGGDFPQEYLDLLNQNGVDTTGIKIIPEGKTFFWAGRYHNDMNTRDTLATELNVLADFNPVVPESYKDCTFLMLGNLTPQIQKSVIEQLPVRPKLIVMDTMNFWMNSAWDDLIEVIGMVDVLTINDEEARQLSGEYSLVKAARKIISMGPKYLVIKKGEHGAFLFNEESVFFAPALPLEEVFDPTGAGDTFAGGFIGFLARTGDISFDNMKRAIIYGSAMASFTVEKFGTEGLQALNNGDLNTRIRQFSSMVQFDIDLD
ncbi:MAG: sugar kinase [Bacteroidetes bacterium HGW-Bacteroidetes-11]|jgi:sugar/nucleoside kinase (ribokinase family)|nr:MAG: sugar kinase [Bacteroidetes bacterium HGW-Bacteroidetes-11]